MKNKKKNKFNSLFTLLERFPTEIQCVKHFEKLRWNGKVVSPFDSESIVYKCAGGRYKCKNSGKYFNVKTATIFESSNIPMQKWYVALYLLTSHKKGISSHQLAKDIKVTQKTAWFILSRLRYAMLHWDYKAKQLSNTVEIDEAYVGGDTANKHQSKKKGIHGEDVEGRMDDKAVVLGMIERDGEVRLQHVEDAKKDTISPIIYKNVKEDSTVITDEFKGYARLQMYYNHSTVNHSLKQYVSNMSHTNNIENFWSIMKRGIYGIYHHTSKAHLQLYLEEFSFRFNNRDLSEQDRCELFLSKTEGRLTYPTLISKKVF